jgi:hypothetical protein
MDDLSTREWRIIIKIDSNFIELWGQRYDEIESDEEDYLFLIEHVIEDVKNNKSISLGNFEKIIDWKSKRAKSIIKWNNYDIYHKAFNKVLEVNFSNKMSELIRLPGIGPPIASTILHFIFPELFPIYDVRTNEVLNNFCYIKHKTLSLSGYLEFQNAIIKIKTELVHYNLRQIDRAIFAYHKINLRKSDKLRPRSENCLISKRIKTPRNSKLDNKSMLKNKLNYSIPEIVKSICEELGANGNEISRKMIINKAKEYSINESSILPADYCDNTRTGRWSKHSFLHSLGRGRYILVKFKSQS